MTDRASCVVLRALCAAVVFSLGVGAAFAQSWTYSNGILTGEDGMKLNATLSNGEVSVTGISDRGALTTIDLRGTVTDADTEATYTIVSAKGIQGGVGGICRQRSLPGDEADRRRAGEVQHPRSAQAQAEAEDEQEPERFL